MFKRSLIILFLLLSATTHAEVKPYMDLMFKEIFTLKPYIVSDIEYRDPKNFQKINTSLKNLAELSEKVSHEGKIKKTGFAISSKAITEQLKEAELVYRVGNKDYSLWMLRSTLSVCMSCHTQLPADSTQFETLSKDTFLAKPFDEAEFLFIVRNFNQALPLYDRVIDSFPAGNGGSQDIIEKAIARKVYYFVRVRRDLNQLSASLTNNLKNKKLPEMVVKRIQALRLAAEKMKNQTYPEFSEKQHSELRKYAETELRSELRGDFSTSAKKDLAYLKVSSVLYKFLEENPDSPMKPDILYWLSFCERRYEQKAFYSLPELYLKQCVMDFPTAPVASACLKEYQDIVTLAYTGSSGTHIPKDVDQELKAMKEMVEKINKKNSP